MDFRISDTFLTSVTRLTAAEQKEVKLTAFDLQVNPASPGLQFHKLERARDKGFWSVRTGRDIRLIVHRSSSSLLLCYAAHHDDAYEWAERRKIETHPTTGAAQLVEVRERVREVEVPRYVDAPAAPMRPVLLFADVPDGELLAYGVPPEWLADVRAATEETLLELADHLPAEAAEALLEVAVGGTPRQLVTAVVPESALGEEAPAVVEAVADVSAETPALPEPQVEVSAEAFEHPDARRRFRTVADAEELERALNYPWDRWTVFLHPSQREVVERDYSGPARVSGSAGTGKTVVALHRAAHLARRHAESRVLLTTFSEPLANALRTQLRRLISAEPRLGERFEVHAVDAIALRLHELNLGAAQLAPREEILGLLASARTGPEAERFSAHFLAAEWDEVVDAWGIETWEGYRDVRRLGRRTRLSEKQRKVLWSVFEPVVKALEQSGRVTMAGVYGRLATHYQSGARAPFDFVIVDEAQDLSVPQMRFLAALGGGRPNGLFFAGDLGQRIFQLPFSWKSLGVDIRGRSHTLRVNYRTSHQIRGGTDRLLPRELADVDGNVETRTRTISVFNGPDPTTRVYDDEAAETKAATAWLEERRAEGMAPHEIGVFVRSPDQLDRGLVPLVKAGIPYVVLDERLKTMSGHASLATMHLAKGLEFRAVAVLACDDEVVPLQERLSAITDPADLEDVYNTERHLLYVACTRARDRLFVSGVRPGSEFLEDLGDEVIKVFRVG